MRLPVTALLLGMLLWVVPSSATARPVIFQFETGGFPAFGCEDDLCDASGIFVAEAPSGKSVRFSGIRGVMGFDVRWHELTRGWMEYTIDYGAEIPAVTIRQEPLVGFHSFENDRYGNQGPGITDVLRITFGGFQFSFEEYYGTRDCLPNALRASRGGGRCAQGASRLDKLMYINFNVGTIDDHDTYMVMDFNGGSTGYVEIDEFRRIAVPEPSTLATLLVGGLLVGLRRRRRE